MKAGLRCDEVRFGLTQFLLSRQQIKQIYLTLLIAKLGLTL
jgi:hypothetical protein